jgi:hypothetical protein
VQHTSIPGVTAIVGAVTRFGVRPISFCKMVFEEDPVNGVIGFAVGE